MPNRQPLSTTRRGYGSDHQRLRKQWARIVEAGEAHCARCGRAIQPGTPWALDHRDDRQGYLGPSHQRCNQAAANRKRSRRAAVRLADKPVPDWWKPEPRHSEEW